MGLPADQAPELARRITELARRAKWRVDFYAQQRYASVRENPGTDADVLAAQLQRYGAAETVAMATEAITLWSADPLPVGDIEYATRMVTGWWN